MNRIWQRVRNVLSGPMRTWLRQTLTIARKELSGYFSSPMALIFVGTFLMVTLFVFFWVEAFFARNIADVRPMFKWMPVLMVFLVAALTMRQWSEEQRGGTLEVLLTLPVYRSALVMGKFLAVVALVAVALALTLSLPITVDVLGDLDWGPVFGGYLAALLLASAYAAVGLFISSRTDNQIVALILTVLVCGALYLVGTSGVTRLAGETPTEIMRAIGTGSRFESIERGVIDLRDLIYYLSLAALFLLLNVVSLDSKRWSRGVNTRSYRLNAWLRVALVGANLLALNTWLFPINTLRADLTAQKEYSLSPATRDLIRSLREPLLMRGYFSEKTHPLLAPLVPTIRDMMQEYEIASGGKVKAEVVDPRKDEKLEEEANQVYGIRPIPFRVLGRYEDTVINSYFDILIRYGDQSVTLGVYDLVEVERSPTGQVSVRLRNLEYDLTRAIKKVVYGFQSLDAALERVSGPVKLTAFITADALPEQLKDAPQIVEKVAEKLQEESGGRLTFEVIDPDATNARVTRDELLNSYGLRPFAVSPFSTDTYYLHLVLEIGGDRQVLYPGANLSEAELRSEIEAAIKRAAPGFLKTVGFWTPPNKPVPNPFGGMSQPISSWETLRSYLAQSYTVKPVNLSDGRVPGDVDVLVVVAPQGMSDKERFAIDQYLMRGGAVIVAAGHFVLAPAQFGGGIQMQAVQDGLEEMLAHYGVKIGQSFVMDPQNEPFPVQVQRRVGNMNVIELHQINYPFFVDVRRDGMARQSPIVANLPAVTLQWVSPLDVDRDKNEGRDVVVLLNSTGGSWLRSDINVNPDLEKYPEYGFPVGGERKSYPLAVSISGSFESYFKGRPSPFEQEKKEGQEEPYVNTIESSPESARLVVIGSSEFVDDVVLDISRNLSRDRYLHNLQLVVNAVDWAVQDRDLLSIRSRGTYAHLLRPLKEGDQSFCEALNYAWALLSVVGIGVLWSLRRRSEKPMTLVEAGRGGER